MKLLLRLVLLTALVLPVLSFAATAGPPDLSLVVTDPTGEVLARLDWQARSDDKLWIADLPSLVPGLFEIQAGAVVTNPDPFIEYAFGVKNFTAMPLMFTFIFATPVVGGPYDTLISSHASTITEGAILGGSPDGTHLVTPGVNAFIHTPSIDGVDTAVGVIGDGCAGAGDPFSGPCDGPSGSTDPIASVSPASLDVTVSFVLSAGDLYSTTGRVEISDVGPGLIPEPSTYMLGLSALGALLVFRRRLRA
jgi:hypothetical protein